MNNLRGAWEFSQNLDKEMVKKILGNDKVLFGEWLVKHTVPYPDDKYKKAYFYDVWDVELQQYLPQDEVKDIVSCLGLTYVPVFYDGEFQSFDHVLEFVGRTGLGGEYGEGVVVKNISRLRDAENKIPFYTKIVADKFSEVKHVKKHNTNNLLERQHKIELTQIIVTEARVRKLICKMIDDGIIPESWDEHDMGIIAKNIGRDTYYDCVKEEPDIVKQIGEGFGKFASSAAMHITRQILSERQNP